MNTLMENLAIGVFTAMGAVAALAYTFQIELLQAAWLSWQWLTVWPLLKVLEWSAAALTIYGAWLLANPGHRWTAWGFVFFLGANALWISYAWLTGQGGLFVQQLVLTGISLQGIWNGLIAPVLDTAFDQLFEDQ